jgi:hypothetical protein
MEQYSDDEFDIYQNNTIANAYSRAKRKVLEKAHKDYQHRQQLKYGSPERIQEGLSSIAHSLTPIKIAQKSQVSPQIITPRELVVN